MHPVHAFANSTHRHAGVHGPIAAPGSSQQLSGPMSCDQASESLSEFGSFSELFGGFGRCSICIKIGGTIRCSTVRS